MVLWLSVIRLFLDYVLQVHRWSLAYIHGQNVALWRPGSAPAALSAHGVFLIIWYVIGHDIIFTMCRSCCIMMHDLEFYKHKRTTKILSLHQEYVVIWCIWNTRNIRVFSDSVGTHLMSCRHEFIRIVSNWSCFSIGQFDCLIDHQGSRDLVPIPCRLSRLRSVKPGSMLAGGASCRRLYICRRIHG